MIFLINSTSSPPPYHLWVPFYIFNGHEYRNPIIAFLICLEFILSLFCVFITIKLTIYIWKIRVFHVNMSTLAIAYISQYLECFVGKTVLTLHQNGFYHVPGVPADRKYTNWWTDDCDEIPVLGASADAFPLFFGGFLIWHYMYSMVGIAFSFCVERMLATVLSGNYEQLNRTYISLLILATSHTSTLYLSYQTFYEHVQMVPTVIACMVCLIISCLMFVVTLLMNQKINKLQTTNSRHFYTLAYRFQVKENIKALKLAQRVILCIAFYVFLNLILLSTVFFNVFEHFNEPLIFLLENCIYLNPLLICPIVFYSIDPWRKALLRELPVLKVFGRSEKPPESGHHQTSDLYFTQLQTSWRKSS
ncbi:unnamed protein product [Caenorhabditis sp. 36 PRJEB53466]|nr:unnamed protein product [Caenorhabditis sp. 36 PRJEB53466]